MFTLMFRNITRKSVNTINTYIFFNTVFNNTHSLTKSILVSNFQHIQKPTQKYIHKLQSFHLRISIDDILMHFSNRLCSMTLMLSANMNAIQLSSHCVRRQYKLNCVRFHININVYSNVH